MTSSDDWSARSSLGGSLRPGDPRRFYIEAMVGAMHADGVIDRRELETLQEMLERHDLFSGLPTRSAQMLIDMSTDAIDFAGGAASRIPVIARHLRWRIDRLAAFAMACEVCGADHQLDPAEEAYLAELRTALRMTEREQRDMLAAARAGRAMTWLADEIARTRTLAPVLIELLLICRRAAGVAAAGEVDDIAGYLVALRDFEAAAQPSRDQVDRLAETTRQWPGARDRIPALAATVELPADRHWLIAYLVAYDLVRERRGWQNNPVVAELGRQFSLAPASLELVREDGRLLSSAMRAS
jgi:hypothetical protein